MRFTPRNIVVGALLLCAVLTAFPPWHTVFTADGATASMPEGYAFIFSGIKYPGTQARYPNTFVDTPRLILSWAVVGFVAAAGVVLTRRHGE